MKAKDLLQEVKKEYREEIKKFISEKPPHPAEVGEANKVLTVPASANSNFDKILIERERIQQDNHVRQEAAVIGLNLQENGPDIPSFLGSWSPETFAKELPKKSVTGPEME